MCRVSCQTILDMNSPILTTTHLTTTPRGALKKRKAAEYISVSEVTLMRLVKRGLIQPCRATRHVLFAVEELNRFLKN